MQKKNTNEAENVAYGETVSVLITVTQSSLGNFTLWKQISRWQPREIIICTIPLKSM